MGIRDAIQGLRSEWRLMTLYERFEQLVALVLVLTIAVVVLVALWNPVGHLTELFIGANLDPHRHKVFQGVFSGIMTGLIAMLALGGVYWLMRERDDRLPPATNGPAVRRATKETVGNYAWRGISPMRPSRKSWKA